jgi:hypothetical protein
MSKKKPIDSFWMKHYSKKEGVVFSSKRLKSLLRSGYCVETVSELWFDSEEGLGYNNWVDEYAEGVWDMSQKEVNDMAYYVVRKFSHLSRRCAQKAIPRAYKKEESADTISFYLYMRDRGYCDYMIFLTKKRGN